MDSKEMRGIDEENILKEEKSILWLVFVDCVTPQVLFHGIINFMTLSCM
jgi:hypothetical protein